jgi:hypothetical protein
MASESTPCGDTSPMMPEYNTPTVILHVDAEQRKDVQDAKQVDVRMDPTLEDRKAEDPQTWSLVKGGTLPLQVFVLDKLSRRSLGAYQKHRHSPTHK